MNKTIIALGAVALVSGTAVAQGPTALPAGGAAPLTQPAATIVPATVTPPVVAAVPLSVTLASGTPVRFRMDHALATDEREFAKGEKKPPKGQRRISNKGDTFTMTVIEDVKQGDYVVVPVGTVGTGEVTMVTGRGGFGKSGKIEIRMNTIDVGGRKYAMDGTHLQKGKGRGGAAVAGTILAGAIAGAFIKGDEADIPLHTELSFRTKEAIVYTAPAPVVPVAVPGNAAPVAPAPSAAPVASTN